MSYIFYIFKINVTNLLIYDIIIKNVVILYFINEQSDTARLNGEINVMNNCPI